MNENKNVRENMEVDLQKLMLTYLRNIWLIVLAAIIVGAGALWYTKNYVVPQYRSNVTIYVNNYRQDAQVEYISGSNLQAAQKLVNTYIAIIQSDTVLTRVVENSDLGYTVEQIRGKITTSQIGETEMFRVYITDPDPAMAAAVANAIATEALSAIEEFVEGSSAKVIDYAKPASSPHSPNYSKNTMTGAVIGAIVAVVILTLRYLLDVRLKTSEDLEQLFSAPVLGQIPSFVSPDVKKKKGYHYGYSRRGYGYTKNGYGYEADRTVKTEEGGE